MRRAFGYAGAWLAATSVAVSISWLGCAIVLNGSSGQTPPVLAALRSHTATAPVAPALGATMVSAPPPATSPAAAERATGPYVSRSSRPAVPGGPPTTVQRGTPPPHRLKPTVLPTSVPPTPSSTPTPKAIGTPSSVDETYQVTGGTATLRFTVGKVLVLALEPSPGYEGALDQSRPDELIVIFKRPGQESDLHAAWDGGPSASVTEYWW